jgi:type VI secretion system protein ImpB
MDWVYGVSALASALAAILAWAAKRRWSKEYAAAKDEVIRAKDEQIKVLEREIESLRRLTPMKIREYFESVTMQLEEYNNHLLSQLATAHAEVRRRNDRIAELQRSAPGQNAEIDRLASERDRLTHILEQLEPKLSFELSKTPLEQGKDVPISLQFHALEDFSPESITHQVPELKKLLDLRQSLDRLKTGLTSSAGLTERLSEVVRNPGLLQELERELALLTPAKADKGPSDS